MVNFLMNLMFILVISHNLVECAGKKFGESKRIHKKSFQKKESSYDHKKIALAIVCAYGAYYSFCEARIYAQQQKQLLSTKNAAQASFAFFQDSFWALWGYTNTGKFETYKKDFVHASLGTFFYSVMTVSLSLISIRLLAKGLYVIEEDD